jgi:hypothetical protein
MSSQHGDLETRRLTGLQACICSADWGCVQGRLIMTKWFRGTLQDVSHRGQKQTGGFFGDMHNDLECHHLETDATRAQHCLYECPSRDADAECYCDDLAGEAGQCTAFEEE